jgi:lysosomal alpha-glucosidase
MGRCDGFWGDPYAPTLSWKSQKTRIGIAVMSGVVLLILIICLSTAGKGSGSTPSLADNKRFDCAPDVRHNDNFRYLCESRGCLYDDSEKKMETNETRHGFSSSPTCFYPEIWVNYEIQEVFKKDDHGITLFLNKTEQKNGFEVGAVKTVKVEVKVIDEAKLRIRMTDVLRQRWEPPMPQLNIPAITDATKVKPSFNFALTDSRLIVTRKSNNALILSTDLRKIIFSDQFLQIITHVPSYELYGIGENLDQHLKSFGPHTQERKIMKLMNFGELPLRGNASYGHHPFYVMYSNDTGDAHGVLLRNVNAMDIVMTATPALTYRTIGGILDFFVFMGPTPDDVMRQKADLIGHSPLPPYWSLGYHLCRYGYENDNEIQRVYERNTLGGLPFDVQWIDIDYMDTWNMFTRNKTAFPKLPEFIKRVHNEGRRFVPIVDPSLDGSLNESSAGYASFLDGLNKDVFVKNTTGQLLKGRVWNTKLSVFPDFTHPNCSGFWSKWLNIFHHDMEFDGIWIDMNEPATFISGQDGGCINNSLDRPQFNPHYPLNLEFLTMCMSAQHYLGPHYDIHNMYAYFEARMTYNALASIRNKRPFVLSRATTTGQGSYSAHWLGDVDSSWDHLRLAIPQILDFGLFGIPFVGTDICGFVKNTTEELCTRWSSVGAFYPFSRNHNDHYFISQDPASPDLGGIEGNVFKSAKKALVKRYTLLPYLYTLFFNNSIYGNPVARSLRHNYPKNKELTTIESQFMWGRDILINPVLEEKKTQVEVVFPPGKWYDWDSEAVVSERSGKKTLDVPLTDISVCFRGGSIIPTHDPNNSTNEQRKGLFNLLVFLDSDSQATGELFYDDGESLNTREWEQYTHIKFDADSKSLKFKVLTGNYLGQDLKNEKGEVIGNTMSVKRITIYGIGNKPEKVTVNSTEIPSTYDEKKRRLTIPEVGNNWNHSLLENFEINW